jgi:hypothetical protein
VVPVDLVYAGCTVLAGFVFTIVDVRLAVIPGVTVNAFTVIASVRIEASTAILAWVITITLVDIVRACRTGEARWAFTCKREVSIVTRCIVVTGVISAVVDVLVTIIISPSRGATATVVIQQRGACAAILTGVWRASISEVLTEISGVTLVALTLKAVHQIHTGATV